MGEESLLGPRLRRMCVSFEVNVYRAERFGLHGSTAINYSSLRRTSVRQVQLRLASNYCQTTLEVLGRPSGDR